MLSFIKVGVCKSEVELLEVHRIVGVLFEGVFEGVYLKLYRGRELINFGQSIF